MTPPIDAQPVHRCFTVDATAYLRNLDRDDLKARCVGINYQPPPKKVEGGTSFGIRFPMLIVTSYLEDPDAVAGKVADLLERHWDAGDQPPEPYLIWSNEYRAWWRPNSGGYTSSLADAGRYDRDNALATCTSSRDGWGAQRVPPEVPVREADALQCQADWLAKISQRDA